MPIRKEELTATVVGLRRQTEDLLARIERLKH